ncbi:PhzF family phenazine biosynthesis protein [Streptomyces sp. NPDC097610]|uniref:PhzF family phenazine biosynthesis protein n=1 Tax=Streptomyces sp. NPDC097610 TaxID=3157227 RepID=UPI003331FC38
MPPLSPSSCPPHGAGARRPALLDPNRGFYDHVPEDPACGSAAGPLAAHLVRHRLLSSGVQLTLSQGEAVNRPSTLYAQAVADQDDIQSIDVGGGVCLIGSGRLRLPGPGGAARPGDRTATA